MSNTDEIMGIEFISGKWDGIREARLIYEAMAKDTDLLTHPGGVKFFWELRKRELELSDLMKEKQENE